MLVMDKKNETKNRSFNLKNHLRPEEGIETPSHLGNFMEDVQSHDFSTYIYPIPKVTARHAICKFPKNLQAIPFITSSADDENKVLLIVKLSNQDKGYFLNWVRVSGCFLFSSKS